MSESILPHKINCFVHLLKHIMWEISDNKSVKIFGKACRVIFNRVTNSVRGLSMSRQAFLRMEDVTIAPDSRLELDPEVWLINYGTRIHLVKYCLTHDEKRCNGGFFHFTPKEWTTFWNVIRPKMLEFLNK